MIGVVEALPPNRFLLVRRWPGRPFDANSTHTGAHLAGANTPSGGKKNRQARPRSFVGAMGKSPRASERRHSAALHEARAENATTAEGGPPDLVAWERPVGSAQTRGKSQRSRKAAPPKDMCSRKRKTAPARERANESGHQWVDVARGRSHKHDDQGQRDRPSKAKGTGGERHTHETKKSVNGN